MVFSEIAGWVGTFISTISLVPQVVKTYQTKSARDLSFFTLLCFFLSAACWISYGVAIRSYPVITTNIGIFSFATFLLMLKTKYK